MAQDAARYAMPSGGTSSAGAGAIRVVHVYKTYFPDTGGGLEQTIRHICLATAAHGVINTVVTTTHGQPGEIMREEARVLRFRANMELASTPWSVSLWRAFRRVTRSADVVHYHFPWPQADLYHLTVAGKQPSIVTYHSDIVRQRILLPLYQPVMNRFLAGMRRIVVTSPNYLESSKALHRYRDKCAVVPIGLEERSYPQATPAGVQKWRQLAGVGFVLFIGVLRYYKGLEYLIRAARGGDYSVVIAGSGPMETELKALAASLGAENVYFAGHVTDDDRASLLQLAGVVAFPSHMRSEAFGVTLLEAAMSGKPMITAEIGTGTSYVNLDAVTGYVVPPADADALRMALERIVGDDALARRMGNAARTRFERLFTAEKMGLAYVRLYDEALRDHGKGEAVAG